MNGCAAGPCEGAALKDRVRSVPGRGRVRTWTGGSGWLRRRRSCA